LRRACDRLVHDAGARISEGDGFQYPPAELRLRKERRDVSQENIFGQVLRGETSLLRFKVLLERTNPYGIRTSPIPIIGYDCRA